MAKYIIHSHAGITNQTNYISRRPTAQKRYFSLNPISTRHRKRYPKNLQREPKIRGSFHFLLTEGRHDVWNSKGSPHKAFQYCYQMYCNLGEWGAFAYYGLQNWCDKLGKKENRNRFDGLDYSASTGMQGVAGSALWATAAADVVGRLSGLIYFCQERRRHTDNSLIPVYKGINVRYSSSIQAPIKASFQNTFPTNVYTSTVHPPCYAGTCSL